MDFLTYNKDCPMPNLLKVFEKMLLGSWWLIVVALAGFLFFEKGIKVRDLEYEKLKITHIELEKQKKEALFLQQKLLLEINSQSDPAWVELVLMKRLGLSPEGQKKVFFDQKINNEKIQ